MMLDVGPFFSAFWLSEILLWVSYYQRRRNGAGMATLVDFLNCDLSNILVLLDKMHADIDEIRVNLISTTRYEKPATFAFH